MYVVRVHVVELAAAAELLGLGLHRRNLLWKLCVVLLIPKLTTPTLVSIEPMARFESSRAVPGTGKHAPSKSLQLTSKYLISYG